MKTFLSTLALSLAMASPVFAGKLSANAESYYSRISNMQPHTLQVLINETSSRSMNRYCKQIMQAIKFGRFSEDDYQRMNTGLSYHQLHIFPMVEELRGSSLVFTAQHLDLLENMSNMPKKLKLCIDKVDAYYE